MAVGRSE